VSLNHLFPDEEAEEGEAKASTSKQESKPSMP
jgi:hypothetical protein